MRPRAYDGVGQFGEKVLGFALLDESQNNVGAGFSNGSGTPPSHLPGHAELNLSAGKAWGQSLSTSLTVLNVTDRHLLIDNSLTFGGFHYNDPREIYAEIRWRFHY